jgi:uncharacterized protein YodC (DUF2158 family)
LKEGRWCSGPFLLGTTLTIQCVKDAYLSGMETESNFNVGDVVQLRSGGPKMTVAKAEGNKVDCIWIDSAEKFREETILSACLVLNTPAPSLPMSGGK